MSESLLGQQGEREESITLHKIGGGSDKLYQVFLVQRGGAWAVDAAWGRRGATMTPKPKTKAPLPYGEAKKQYDKIVRGQKSEGYHDYNEQCGRVPNCADFAGQAEGGQPAAPGAAVMAAGGPAQTDTYPQLLNEVGDESEVERLIEDNSFAAEEKFDGKRVILRRQGGEVVGINRKGKTCAVAVAVEGVALSLAASLGDFLIDGEAVGDVFYAFDLLESAGADRRALPFRERRALLAEALLSAPASIQLSPLAVGVAAKRELYGRLKSGGREGIVFKKLGAPYRPGRPNRGGDQLKFKFCATGSFIVTSQNVQRSVAVHALDAGGGVVPLGNVTIPANKDVPAEGAIVEIRYLYAYRGGSLYQPVYLGERDDLTPEDCRTSQLKYKAEGAEDEDEAEARAA